MDRFSLTTNIPVMLCTYLSLPLSCLIDLTGWSFTSDPAFGWNLIVKDLISRHCPMCRDCPNLLVVETSFLLREVHWWMFLDLKFVSDSEYILSATEISSVNCQ
jgi:hypothetical protein